VESFGRDKNLVMVKLIVLVLMLFIAVTNAYHHATPDPALDLISRAGYRGESHQVEVRDGSGWVLKMQRIPPKNPRYAKPFPVFLFHGLFAASGDYLITGKKIALAYLLADNNYDVWLGNCRGNRHSSVNLRTARYDTLWTFSFNEIGLYDVSAMIDYVLKYTQREKVLYVGHSQGTTSLIALLAMRPEYNEKIAQAHLLAPVAFQQFLPHPLIRKFARVLDDGFAATGEQVLNLGSIFILGNPLSKVWCNETVNYHTTQFCKSIIYAIVGRNKYQEEIDSVKLMISLMISDFLNFILIIKFLLFSREFLRD
jgi:lysosomal acid lipase/cholesteryl ester hydrolase